MMADNIKDKEQITSVSENKRYMQTLDDTRTINLLITLLNESVEKCYTKDNVLIENCMEQASVARIFYYMQNAIIKDKRFISLRRLNLDCEYFKNNDDLKRTNSKPKGTRPDLILHQRKNNRNNFLVVEFKTHKNNRYNADFNKLKDFTSVNGTYNYTLGVFVKLKYEKASYTYFIKGEEIPKQAIF